MKYFKIMLIGLSLVSVSTGLSAQEGIGVKYLFPQKMLEQFLVRRTANVPDTLGYFIADDKTGKRVQIIGKNERQIVTYEPFTFRDSLGNMMPIPKMMMGNIDAKRGDTLFISVWHFKHHSKFERLYPDVSGNSYAFIIKPWRKHGRDDGVDSLSHYKGLYSLPKWYAVNFKHMYLGATTIPFRVKIWDGNVDEDFLNANVSCGYLWGKTRLYKYGDIKPRNFSMGLGAFLGLVAIDDHISDKKRLGFSWGLQGMANVFNNLSILVAVGANTNFGTKYNKEASNPDGSINWKGFMQPYVGIGFGYGLYSLYQIGTQK